MRWCSSTSPSAHTRACCSACSSSPLGHAERRVACAMSPPPWSGKRATYPSRTATVGLARATGRPLVLGAHDRVVVAQVVADLGRAWEGPAVLLELTGPAGGRWALGDGSPVATVRADAVDYLRALSGRNDHPALEADGDHAAAAAVAAARVVF